MAPLLVLCAWLAGAYAQAVPQNNEKIVDIRVHGNHLTSDADVIALSGLVKDTPFTDDTIPSATRKLKASGKFDDVEVLKRFASIDDMSQIIVMLIVNEGPVRIDFPDVPGATPRIVRRRGSGNFMYMPILDAEDGYGLRYGVRVAVAKPVGLGNGGRLSFPFTWGGEHRAGAELEKAFRSARVQIGGALTSREHPFYEIDDNRRSAWTRVDGTAGRLHLGATAGVDRVHFGDDRDIVKSIGGDAVLDTRLDVLLPRNAVFVTASAGRFNISPVDAEAPGAASASLTRTRIDAQGFLGAFRQTVIAARIVREDASAPLPRYMKSMLGGMQNLRGFRAGQFVGDTLVAGSLELRVPTGSPLEVAKFGYRIFVDAGTVYDKGQRYRDQTLKQGYGAGIFMTAAVFHLDLDVAHGKGGGTRVHFGGGFSF